MIENQEFKKMLFRVLSIELVRISALGVIAICISEYFLEFISIKYRVISQNYMSILALFIPSIVMLAKMYDGAVKKLDGPSGKIGIDAAFLIFLLLPIKKAKSAVDALDDVFNERLIVRYPRRIAVIISYFQAIGIILHYYKGVLFALLGLHWMIGRR